MTITIYHNPRCSKSRETLALLREYEVEPHIVEYLNSPPSRQRLGAILGILGLEPRQFMRQNEAPYTKFGLDDPGLDRAALLTAMTENPVLIERPIVVNGTKAALNRPSEAVLEII